MRALHTLALLAFALAQPLLEVLGRNVEFLVAHQADALDLALLAFAVALGAPGVVALAKWALERVAARLALAIHLAAVAVLAAAVALLILKEGDAGETPGWVLVPGALALGAAAAMIYARSRFGPAFLTMISPAPLVFPLLFLFASPAGEQLGPAAAWRAGADPTPGAVASDTPVVVVVFSALPLTSLLDDSKQIDPHLFPNFAALAERAHFFRNTTTVAETSTYALPAILTGLYPAWKRPPNPARYPQTLFSLLEESHDFNVFESVTRLCRMRLCTGSPTETSRSERLTAIFSELPFIYLHHLLPEDWTRRLPDVRAAWTEFSEADRGDAKAWFKEVRRHHHDMRWIFSQFLARVFDRGEPTLHFLHATVPHGPHKYLPSGRQYRPTGIHPDTRRPHGGAADVRWAETQALQRHLLQVGYADTLVGQLLEHLERKGLFDRALVVITADHGVSFRPRLRQYALHRKNKNAGDILLVPLLIKLPGQREGGVSDRNVETVDILPTILDILGLDPSEPLQGRSLLDASAPERPERPEKVVYRTPRRGKLMERKRKVLEPVLPSALGTVQRISEIFGRGKDREALFAVGEHRELLGQSVAAVPDGGVSPFAVRLDDRSAYDEVDPDSDFVPAHVTGSLEAEAIPEDALDLAVAVNGVVRAVTRSFSHRGQTARFTAMLPEQAFGRGRNQIEVLLVRRDPEGIALLRTDLHRAVTYSVVLTHEQTPGVVLSSEGRLYPVIPNAVSGRVSRSGNSFSGGATDVLRTRVAEVVLMFAGGRLQRVRALGEGSAEADAAGGGGDPRLAVPQFRFSVPSPRLAAFADRDLRFLGLTRDAAAELEYKPSRSRAEAWSGPSSALAIERREGGEGIAASSGEWFPLRASGVRGRVEAASPREGRIAFSGWAADIESGTPPRAVLVFVDGHFVARAGIELARPEVAAELGSASFERPGFEIELPGELVGEARELRFLVPSPSGTVAEVEYAGDYSLAPRD
jgi:hypothetical protein